MEGYQKMRDNPPPTAPPPYSPSDYHATGGRIYQPRNFGQPILPQQTIVHIPQMAPQPIIGANRPRECCCCCCSCPFWVCCLIMALLILIPLITTLATGH